MAVYSAWLKSINEPICPYGFIYDEDNFKSRQWFIDWLHAHEQDLLERRHGIDSNVLWHVTLMREEIEKVTDAEWLVLMCSKSSEHFDVID